MEDDVGSGNLFSVAVETQATPVVLSCCEGVSSMRFMSIDFQPLVRDLL